MPLDPSLPTRLKEIRGRIRNEYLEQHLRPWIIGFSAGKDSTLLLQLVFEAILSAPPDSRVRHVYVLSNDTLVESPVYQSSVDRSLEAVRAGAAALRLPITVAKTHPQEDSTFWVNLLGRGYPAPNRNFRWCTDRMKIRPTTKYIRDKISELSEVILLLGVRKDESAARAARINAYHERDRANGSHLHPHNDIPGCLIFRPIVDLATDDVWHVLLNSRPPWGGTHRDLITLYRNANGGECPFVVSHGDAPSCGTSSARFGCWTCTVVVKDRSLEALIDAGFEHLEPLAEFRDRIKDMSADPACRSKTRRNGKPGLGPLTVEARGTLLDELLAIQGQTEMPLITEREVQLIKYQWQRDETDAILREFELLATNN